MRTPRLSITDLALLARISGALGVVTVLRRTSFSLDRLVRLLERAPRADVVADVERAVGLTDAVLRRTHRRDFCYPRALVLFHVLTGWGCPVTMHFGVRKKEGALDGHAWLEVAGSPLAEAQDPKNLYHITRTYSSTQEVSYESENIHSAETVC